MSSKIPNALLIDLCAKTVLPLVRDYCEIETSGNAGCVPYFLDQHHIWDNSEG